MPPRPNHLPAWQDFSDIVELADSELVGARFQFTYFCRGALKKHVASYDGNALLTGCTWGNREHTVVAVAIDMKRISMRPGCSDPIHVVREFWIADSSFPDGFRNKVIEDTLWPESNTPTTYSTVVINALRGLSAYDLYVQQGGNLPLQDWLAQGGYTQEVMQTINSLVTNLRETLGLDITQAIQAAHQAMVDEADRAAAHAQTAAQSAKQAADSVQDAEAEAEAAQAEAEASQQSAAAAAAALAEARAKVAQILAAIAGLNPSQSADDAVRALAARQGVMEVDLNRLDKEINNRPVDVGTSNNADFSISDAAGNVICKFEDGHIKTKRFDSKENYSKREIDSLIEGIGGNSQLDILNLNGLDFAISDAAGNVVLKISGGHIKTKNFDSRDKVNIFRQTKLGKPLCICHGRMAATGTENTLPYFRAGVAKGYQFFECDAVHTSDGVAVCSHVHSLYTVKNRNTGENEDIEISAFTYDELISTYTWPDGTEILKTKDLIYYLCYVKRYPLWIDGQDIDDTIRKDLSSYACSIGVGEYVFHERNVVFDDIPISNCIANVALNDMVAFANAHKKSSNNIIFHIPSTLTNEEVRQYSDAAHSVDCYACSYTFSDVAKVRDYMMNGADFIITNGIVDNQI